jgi:DNA-binding transcriptional ArsR family regulator
MDVFSAVAQPTRRSILEMLASSGRLSSSEIARRFRVSPPAISQHLKILREARLVRMHKHGQQRIYEVNPEAMHELEDWARQTTAQWEERLDALERLVQAEEDETNKPRGEKERNHDEAE